LIENYFYYKINLFIFNRLDEELIQLLEKIKKDRTASQSLSDDHETKLSKNENEQEINNSNINKISALNKNDSGFSEITTNSLNIDGNLDNDIDSLSFSNLHNNGIIDNSGKSPVLEINENNHAARKLSQTVKTLKKNKRLTDVESLA
jgi:hypothetical protein